jgi:hypothetical protein
VVIGHPQRSGPVPHPHIIGHRRRRTILPRGARSAQGACPRFDQGGVWLFDLDVRCQLAVSTSGFGRRLWVCSVALVWPFLGEDGVDVLVGPVTFPPG